MLWSATPSSANRGLSYRGKGESDRAITDYDRAIRLGPNSVQSLNNRGAVYYDKMDYERAIADYDAALKIDAEGFTRQKVK